MKTATEQDELNAISDQIIDQLIEEERVNTQMAHSLVCPFERLNFCLDQRLYIMASQTFDMKIWADTPLDLVARTLIQVATDHPSMQRFHHFEYLASHTFLQTGSLPLAQAFLLSEERVTSAGLDLDAEERERHFLRFIKNTALVLLSPHFLYPLDDPSASKQNFLTLLKSDPVREHMQSWSEARPMSDFVKLMHTQLFHAMGSTQFWGGVEQWVQNQSSDVEQQTRYLEEIFLYAGRREELDVLKVFDQWLVHHPHRQPCFDAIVQKHTDPATTSFKEHHRRDLVDALSILMEAYEERREVLKTKEILIQHVGLESLQAGRTHASCDPHQGYAPSLPRPKLSCC